RSGRWNGRDGTRRTDGRHGPRRSARRHGLRRCHGWYGFRRQDGRPVDMSRLTVLHINIIGVVVAIIVGLGLYFTLITGATDQKQTEEGKLKAILDREAKLPAATAALKKAMADKASAETDYKIFDQIY